MNVSGCCYRERRMPKAVLLSPYLDSYLALLARCGERMPLTLSPTPLGKSYPPPAALTLTPSPAGLPQAGCSAELGPVHGLLPPFLMLIRAGSGEHVWNQVPRRAPSSPFSFSMPRRMWPDLPLKDALIQSTLTEGLPRASRWARQDELDVVHILLVGERGRT